MLTDFQRACVTGGAGFIGSRLAHRLIEAGLEVTVLDDLSIGREEKVPPRARLVKGSILNPSDCAQALEGCDLLFHLAARVAIRSSFEFVVEDTMCNVVGTASILKAATKADSVRRVIAASSMAVYSDSNAPAPIPETYETLPVSPYGISKLALEQLTHRMSATAGFESMVLRLFNTYGPGQRFSPYVGVITIFVNTLASGKQATIFGDGFQARDFVHVDDVVQGFMAAADSSANRQTINIGTGQARTVNQLFDIISRLVGSNLPPLYGPAVTGELRYCIASIEKARQLLGYRPVHNFETTIPKVVSDVLAEIPRV